MAKQKRRPVSIIPAALLWMFLAAAPFLPAQSGNLFKNIIPGGHRGAVNSVLYDGEQILSAGEDGFLEIWNIKGNAAEKRFQISSYAITSMTRRPGKPQIACIESDGLGTYRVSAWDYEKLQNVFTLRLRDSISYINYSAAGNFLIAARSGGAGLVFINADTGETLQSPTEISGIISLAVTGRSGRNMITYSPAGVLSYWDLDRGNETNRFTVPSNLDSPMMFGNNRFFAGIDSGGLVVLDAVTGNELDREKSIPRGAQISPGNGDNEFICLVRNGPSPGIYLFRMGSARKLETAAHLALPAAGNISVAAAASNLIALGAKEGNLLLLERSGSLKPMAIKKQERIIEAAIGINTASPSRLAFLAENNYLGFIPLDFAALANRAALRLESAAGYTHIAAVPALEGFVLWQTGNARSFPVIKDPGTLDLILNRIPLRSPIRSVAILDDLGLFLNSSGSITVVSLQTGEVKFSYSSIGSTDAAFIDKNNIVLGRSAAVNIPFLKINITTGETVPLPYDSPVAVKVYRALSGNIYAAVVDQKQDEENDRTVIVKMNPSNPSQSNALAEYQGEDTAFDIAEAGSFVASTMGGDGAAIYTPGDSIHIGRGAVPFERGPGIPKQLIGAGGMTGGTGSMGGGPWFIAIDSDGSVSWHDAGTGSILAMFRLYENEWILDSKSNGTKRGPVTR